MKSLGKLFKNRLLLGLMGMIFLSLFIWFAGPFLGYSGTAPLESKLNRLLAIGSMSMMWFIMEAVRFIKSRTRNAQMLDALANDEISSNESASAEELQILQSKMEGAIDTLKKRNFSRTGGSRFLYELPWYVIIGPPGSGKTTLLSNSGLDFPLEDTQGKFSIKGLGGTRNCDWWFTEQAVLLDTAGRYTTQDSEAEVDKSAWTGFLSMLREKRAKRPINGVLLALSIEDILTGNEAKLEQTAKTLRHRIEELYTQLGIAPPVYLMFTKCDMLAGFAEYFDNLDKHEREQVWGHTLSLEDDDHSAALKNGVHILAEHLKTQTIAKLHSELSQKNRENIYGFPLQFTYARKRIDTFLTSLTAPSRLLQPVMFRGVYFTSATQTGSVFEQVIKNVSQSFGMSETKASTTANRGRSYFIKRLLNDVVFGEAGLAGINLTTEKRFKRFQWVAAMGICALAIGLFSVWSNSYVRNNRLIDHVDVTATELKQSVDDMDASSLDLMATNDILTNARTLAMINIDDDKHDGFVIKRAGLYQGNKISYIGGTKYDELLLDVLLPRLMIRLEHQMHARNTNSEFLFEALKTYQMIGDRDRFDSEVVVGWFLFDFDTNLPVETSETVRSQLKAHVFRLFSEMPRRLSRPLDNSIIGQYQQIAANTPLPTRAYNRIRNGALSDVNTFLKLTTLVDPDLPRVFKRQDDVSLDQSLQRFYSVDGFRQVFLPASLGISQTLIDDAWVLGPFSSTAGQAMAPEDLKSLVTELYYNDYIAQWEALFSNLTMRSVRGLQQATEFVALITDADSPLKKFLIVANEETTLTPPLIPDQDAYTGEGTAQAATLGGILGTADTTVGAAQLTDLVTEHFSPLHKLVEGFESNSSTLDVVLTQLAELNIQLLPLAQSPAGTVDAQLNDELSINIQKLGLTANRLAEPMASLVAGLTNEIKDVVGGGICQQLDVAWKADVLPYYQRAIRSRYPVNNEGTLDIALTDFGTFFGPDGVVDKFVNTYLSGRITRESSKWTWAGDQGAPVCLTANTLKQLKRANDIQNTFFTQGGKLPSFQFEVQQPEEMHAGINDLFMDVGGRGFRYSHTLLDGSTSFTWPSPTNSTQVSLRVNPAVPGSSSNISISGPWAILRLFDRGIRDAGSGRLTVNYSFGGRYAILTFTSSSFNPLNSVSLRNFRAPESL